MKVDCLLAVKCSKENIACVLESTAAYATLICTFYYYYYLCTI